ncbi:hypothetical protein [Maribacter aestuarii]|uniref:hypothetical protein n=1 Tax=Maribacter aestuarii TaxID=1130723 RepID=UPI00248D1F95|nr:hypothetical protein [Maribacter aestuarii]
MIYLENLFTTLYAALLSENTREKIEKTILSIALFSFFVHLILIYLVKMDIIPNFNESELLQNPISSIYTPFSFILVYEVYLLIFYLPKSFTTYITKQYEIITLIIIRKLFNDLSALELTSNWFEIKGDLQFTYDLIASLLLFYLIFLFERQGKKKLNNKLEDKPIIERFIKSKKIIAVILVPLFLIMAVYTFMNWSFAVSMASDEILEFNSINNLFFDQFFTILILVDVILLLISFFYTNQFHKIIRNSGFVISTILIRLSFGVSGLTSTVLIVVAVLFGLTIIVIHNKYENESLASNV